MDITASTPAQILIFKQAAAKRFKEKGIDPKQAEAVFNKVMTKAAEDLGVQGKEANIITQEAPAVAANPARALVLALSKMTAGSPADGSAAPLGQAAV